MYIACSKKSQDFVIALDRRQCLFPAEKRPKTRGFRPNSMDSEVVKVWLGEGQTLVPKAVYWEKEDQGSLHGLCEKSAEQWGDVDWKDATLFQASTA